MQFYAGPGFLFLFCTHRRLPQKRLAPGRLRSGTHVGGMLAEVPTEAVRASPWERL